MRVHTLVAWLCCLFLAVLGCFQGARGPSTSIREEREVRYRDGHTETESIERVSEAGTVRAKNVKELNPGTASIRDGRLNASGPGLESFRASGLSPLYIIGGLVLAGGIAAGFLVGWNVGLALAAAGVALLVTARLLDVYPWVVLAAGLAFVGAGAYMLYMLWRGKRAAMVNEAVVPAVEELEGLVKIELEDDVKPKDAAKLVTERFKDKIKARAGLRARAVKSEVLRVKRRLNLA